MSPRKWVSREPSPLCIPEPSGSQASLFPPALRGSRFALLPRPASLWVTPHTQHALPHLSAGGRSPFLHHSFVRMTLPFSSWTAQAPVRSLKPPHSSQEEKQDGFYIHDSQVNSVKETQNIMNSQGFFLRKNTELGKGPKAQEGPH